MRPLLLLPLLAFSAAARGARQAAMPYTPAVAVQLAAAARPVVAMADRAANERGPGVRTRPGSAPPAAATAIR